MPSFLSKLVKWFKTDFSRVDENTSVTSIGRDEYEYHEGDHQLKVEIELLTGKPDYCIYARTIRKWLPPYEDEPITQVDRERILRKLGIYLDNIKASYEIEGG